MSLFGFENLVLTDILVTRHHLCKKAFLEGHDYRAHDTHLRRIGLSDLFIDAQFHAASSGSTFHAVRVRLGVGLLGHCGGVHAVLLPLLGCYVLRRARALVRVGYFAWRRQCRDCRAARGERALLLAGARLVDCRAACARPKLCEKRSSLPYRMGGRQLLPSVCAHGAAWRSVLMDSA